MTTEEKVTLVESVWETFGLGSALAAVDLPKSTWYYQQKHRVSYEEKYAHLQPILEEIARKHPEYGRPRIMAELRDTYGQDVNHKVVQRLLQVWELRLMRSIRRPKPSGVRQAIISSGKQVNLVAQLDKIELFQVSYTDFTELVYANGRRKAQLLPIIGHVSKIAYGWAVSEHADTELALLAWEQVKKTWRRLDIPYAGMIVHHDQDAVFTGYEWARRLVLEDGVRLSFTLRGFKDNPEMESFNGRFKEENHSLFLEAQTLDELIEVVNERMRYYNEERRHSSIGYLSPLTFIDRVHSGREG
jgi:transposase InsO family protein